MSDKCAGYAASYMSYFIGAAVSNYDLCIPHRHMSPFHPFGAARDRARPRASYCVNDQACTMYMYSMDRYGPSKSRWLGFFGDREVGAICRCTVRTPYCLVEREVRYLRCKLYISDSTMLRE